MKRTRYIACWLLVVYLLTAIGPAYASLTCRCRIMTARTEAVDGHHHGHDGCSRHCSIRTTAEQSACWTAPCCSDRHSTEIALYTNGSDERPDRIVLLVLTALLPDDLPTAAPNTPLIDCAADRRTPFLCRGSIRGAGLRAPPAHS